ncbi:unnamed protein product, partial [Urochloa humidicola]
WRGDIPPPPLRRLPFSRSPLPPPLLAAAVAPPAASLPPRAEALGARVVAPIGGGVEWRQSGRAPRL